MKEYEKLKKPREIAKWICANVLDDDCDNCPVADKCSRGNNAIEEMLNKEVPGRKSRECVNCSKLFDCFGKPEMVDECLHFEERRDG